jgi:hypothetical protein
MTQTIINLGTGGALLNGQNGSTTGADTNDATFLDWPGSNGGSYVYLPGVAGNYLSVPDEAALNLPDDFDLQAWIAFDTYTPAADQQIITKATGTAGTSNYRFFLRTNGTLRLAFGDGSTSVSPTSSVAVELPDGAAVWVRVLRVKASGEVKFFTSDDGVAWVQLGTTQTGFTATAATTSNPFQVGMLLTSSQPATMKVFRARVYDGDSDSTGSLLLDIDTSVITSGSATSFTAVTGQTVTINRSTSGRKSVAVVSPVWLFGTDDFMEWADNALLNFNATDSFTVLAVKRIWGNQSGLKPTVVKRNSSFAEPGYGLEHGSGALTGAMRLRDATTSVAQVGDAVVEGAVSVIAGVVDRVAQTVKVNVDGVSSGTTDISARGSFVNTDVLRVAAFPNTTSGASDMEFIAGLIYRRALTAQEIASITAYYQARLT